MANQASREIVMSLARLVLAKRLAVRNLRQVSHHALPIIAFSAYLLVACGQTPPPPRNSIVAPIASAKSSTPSAPNTSPIARTTSSAQSPHNEPIPIAPAKTPSQHRVSLTLEPGKPPCTLVLEGQSFDDHPEWFVITSVTRMATENGESCAAGVFYDLSKETRKHPEAMDPEPLVAGSFQKPGQTVPTDADGPFWNLTEDLNFDGIVDLCVVVMTGAYNYSQQCWLFDKSSRTFARHTELDDLIFLKVDHQKKKITSAFRAGGPVYENNEYVWQQDTLTKTFQSISYFGEKPDGTPLASGFSHWLIRKELRAGTLVKTFEGAIRSSQ